MFAFLLCNLIGPPYHISRKRKAIAKTLQFKNLYFYQSNSKENDSAGSYEIPWRAILTGTVLTSNQSEGDGIVIVDRNFRKYADILTMTS